jgi:hypothetical protein
VADEGTDPRRLRQLQSDGAAVVDGSLTRFKSQCFFWKIGMSEKAQKRWVLIRELEFREFVQKASVHTTCVPE